MLGTHLSEPHSSRWYLVDLYGYQQILHIRIASIRQVVVALGYDEPSGGPGSLKDATVMCRPLSPSIDKTERFPESPAGQDVEGKVSFAITECHG